MCRNEKMIQNRNREIQKRKLKKKKQKRKRRKQEKQCDEAKRKNLTEQKKGK